LITFVADTQEAMPVGKVVATGAALTGAVVGGAVVMGAVLGGAVVMGAVVMGAVVGGAVVMGAVVGGAVVGGAVVMGAVVGGAVGPVSPTVSPGAAAVPLPGSASPCAPKCSS
jgi:hypothetical protein